MWRSANLLLPLLLWAEFALVIGQIVAGKAELRFGKGFRGPPPSAIAFMASVGQWLSHPAQQYVYRYFAPMIFTPMLKAKR
jgi:hypothetical protein